MNLNTLVPSSNYSGIKAYGVLGDRVNSKIWYFNKYNQLLAFGCHGKQIIKAQTNM